MLRWRYKSFSSYFNDRDFLQDSIIKLQNWAEVNGLTLNPSKTYHMSYGKKVLNSCYFLKGVEIEKATQSRILGSFLMKILHSWFMLNRLIEEPHKWLVQPEGSWSTSNTPYLSVKYSKYISSIWNQDRIGVNNNIYLLV